jgi:pimeloyl-ACP methyl ester carboxylesterase
MSGCGRACRKSIAVLVAVATLAVFRSTPAGALTKAGAAPPSTPCTEARFKVTGAGLTHGRYTVAASLCAKDPANKRVLLITAHGATYNRLYWNWPQNPQVYSFVEQQPESVTVLNLDLLGSGRSSHPASAYLTLPAQASAIHQIVRTMRARGFEKIVLIGHSSGSGVVTQEAATYHDVDGLIVTGFLHRFGTSPLPGALAVPMALYPAMLDPRFASKGLDPGYLTTRPGERGNSGFYNTAAADPAVIAYDDAHKDVVSAAHAMGFVAVVSNPTISRAVDVPVLSIVGSLDGGFCDAPNCPQANEEAAAWSPAAQLEVRVIPTAGHDIHLHGAPYADAEFRYIREWLGRTFEPSTRAPALLESQTTVSGASFYGYQRGRTDMQVIVDAEVSVPVLSPLGKVTHATITFEVGLPDRTLTLIAPIQGPCPAHCFASADFYSEVDCSATDPGIWVRAIYSGEALGPPVDVAISGPSSSEVYRMSRCPTYRA